MTVYFFRKNKLIKAGENAKPVEAQDGFYYTL